jgi:uncharacterized membrane protein
MKLIAAVIALALVAPAESTAQVFRSEPTVKAKAKKDKSARSRSRSAGAPSGTTRVKKERDSKVSDRDVVVIIEEEG